MPISLLAASTATATRCRWYTAPHAWLACRAWAGDEQALDWKHAILKGQGGAQANQPHQADRCGSKHSTAQRLLLSNAAARVHFCLPISLTESNVFCSLRIYFMRSFLRHKKQLN